MSKLFSKDCNCVFLPFFITSLAVAISLGMILIYEKGYDEGINSGMAMNPEPVQIPDEIEMRPEPTPTHDTHEEQLYPVSIDDDPMKGSPDAEITIIEFSDFQCPFCLRFYSDTLPLLEQNYVNTGLVNFVYRDFPLAMHSNAFPAHIAAECADEQGAFWPYHDMLFDRQNEWSALPRDDVNTTFGIYADSLSLNRIEFDSCLNSDISEEIRNDYAQGGRYGVDGTPGFFIGNDNVGYQYVSGAQPYHIFAEIIDSLL